MGQVLQNPQHKKAIVSAFKAYDKDKTGSVDVSEITQVANDLLSFLAQTHPSDKISDFIGPLVYGDYVLSDLKSNPDCTFYRHAIAQRFGKQLVRALDKDGDGKITLQEWEKFDWGSLTDVLAKGQRDEALAFVSSLTGNWDLKFGSTHPSHDVKEDWVGNINIQDKNTVTGTIKKVQGKTVLGTFEIESGSRLDGYLWFINIHPAGDTSLSKHFFSGVVGWVVRDEITTNNELRLEGSFRTEDGNQAGTFKWKLYKA
eukprot:TRINITY_DN3465_c0_g1_i1.p1 TRINITY_DN3465_c0_g1~~TRINITY_DN3465_c0_g1_i1.p1  ORF type:complete len:282 (-),score=79.75 TRINITY_DN3465_c0_g1_i1:75-848(-)